MWWEQHWESPSIASTMKDALAGKLGTPPKLRLAVKHMIEAGPNLTWSQQRISNEIQCHLRQHQPSALETVIAKAIRNYPAEFEECLGDADAAKSKLSAAFKAVAPQVAVNAIRLWTNAWATSIRLHLSSGCKACKFCGAPDGDSLTHMLGCGCFLNPISEAMQIDLLGDRGVCLGWSGPGAVRLSVPAVLTQVYHQLRRRPAPCFEILACARAARRDLA